MKFDYKNHIENRIEDSGDNQKIKWRLAVSKCTKHRCERIVGSRHEKSRIDDRQIRCCLVDNLIRAVHQSQNRVVKCQKRQRHHDNKRHTEFNRNGYIVTHPLIILCTETLRHHDRKSARESIEPSDHQKVEWSRASDCCKRIYTDVTSGDNGIYQIIKLLKNIPQIRGNHKSKDQPYRTSLCHIICHKTFLPVFLSCSFYPVPLDFCPKPSGLVHLKPMTELVHNNIVEHFLRCKNQTPAEIQVALITATSPARLRILDRDFSVIHSDLLCK